MTARTRTTIAVASIALAIVGYAIGARTQVQTRARVPAPSMIANASAPHAEATTIDAQPPDTPLARYTTLERLATDGDRDAAAGLAKMLRPCALQIMYEGEAVHFEAELDEESDLRRRFGDKPKVMESYLQQADIARNDALAARTACDGLSPEQILARGHWLYRAGELGDAASALEFAGGDFLRYQPLTHLDEVAFWRDHAESMAQRALAGGERDAVRLLARGYDPSRDPWVEGPRFAPDPVSAYEYYLLESLTGKTIDVQVEGPLDRIDALLTDDERASARAAAAEICMNELALVCDIGAHGAD